MLSGADACYAMGSDGGPLAQLVEQQTLNLRVRGSSPWRLTNKSTTYGDSRGIHGRGCAGTMCATAQRANRARVPAALTCDTPSAPQRLRREDREPDLDSTLPVVLREAPAAAGDSPRPAAGAPCDLPPHQVRHHRICAHAATAAGCSPPSRSQRTGGWHRGEALGHRLPGGAHALRRTAGRHRGDPRTRDLAGGPRRRKTGTTTWCRVWNRNTRRRRRVGSNTIGVGQHHQGAQAVLPSRAGARQGEPGIRESTDPVRTSVLPGWSNSTLRTVRP